ncbi:MAG: family 78 glycoside hydrolase catalytic domain [Oscillospiraceae bacterium]|nr:family 78 glycoside hydrolase catalytic domain [Oscillospiraceae bacterium]
MRANHIRTEYLRDPLGIDILNPRIFWNCDGGVKQTAFQIVSDSLDTGKVESDNMQYVWPNKLCTGERVTFRIRLWDENGEEGELSDEHFFEAGLLDPKDWKGEWITGDYKPNKTEWTKKQLFGRNMLLNGIDYLVQLNRPDNTERYPADCFRKQFELSGKISRARLYMTACGLYEAKINGRKAGDFCLAPGYTDYRRRIQYQTIDVTELLKDGKNVITAELADGWYRGGVGAWGLKQEYGYETKLLGQLEVTYEDGRKETIVTDGSWDWSNDGPIRFADNKDGEIVDANMVPTYSEHAKVTSCNVIPTASNNVPITEHERFTPTMFTTPSGKTILDMGQNFAGYISFSVDAKGGEKIFLRFGELIDDEGEFTQKNIQTHNKHTTSPLQQISYTCKPGKNEYKTKFAIFGYQYVLVETDLSVTPDQFTGIAVYSDLEQTGKFSSSNDLLNRFVDAAIWSTKSNNADIPTDCPTRERHGWTGDAQIFFGSASYLFDYAAFIKKYLNDLYDWQEKDGKLLQIVPQGGTDFYMDTMNGSVGWSDAGVLIPYRFSRKYDDDRILKDYYSGMKRYADFMITRIGKNDRMANKNPLKGPERNYIVNKGQAYGEWAEPADVYANDWKNVVYPEMEVATAYTSYVLGLMAEIASSQGDTPEAEKYRYWSEKCREGYQALVDTPEHTLDTDRQAKLVRPLYMNLLNEEQTKYAKERLIKAMENYGWRLGTGFLSTPLILDVLKDIDIEAAYKLLENEEIPGWLSMPKNGATTIWEDWEGRNAQAGIASLNHYSKAAVVEWLFGDMCGIKVDGRNKFRIAPLPGGHFTHAEASYQSIYGKVESGWEKTEEGWRFTVTVPSNCEANVVLPDGSISVQTAGTQTYEVKA